MMTEREGWEMHGLEAIETSVIQNSWKQYIEEVRAMKLTYHIAVLDNYMSKSRNNIKPPHGS